MPKYKVLGRKMFDYMIDVEAGSLDEAYDKAMQAESNEWSNIVNDDVIEPLEVYNYDLSVIEDEELSLIEDDDPWPELTSGIVTGA